MVLFAYLMVVVTSGLGGWRAARREFFGVVVPLIFTALTITSNHVAEFTVPSNLSFVSMTAFLAAFFVVLFLKEKADKKVKATNSPSTDRAESTQDRR